MGVAVPDRIPLKEESRPFLYSGGDSGQTNPPVTGNSGKGAAEEIPDPFLRAPLCAEIGERQQDPAYLDVLKRRFNHCPDGASLGIYPYWVLIYPIWV